MAKSKLFLIDGHALCYRSFYAIKSLTTSKGQPTNAVYGFIRGIRSILEEYHPDYLAVCFDSKEKTRRQEKFSEYKIHRPPMPDDLKSQIPTIKEVMRAYHLAIFELGGYEADDIIAGITQRFSSKDLDIVIVSDDKDMYQLAGEHVQFFNSKESMIVDSAMVQKKLGFHPKHIVDFIGLVGDASDNIPGVKGVGPVNAKNLINEFGSLEGVLGYLEGKNDLTAKEQLIADQKKMALFSKELAILDADVPLKYDLTDLKVETPDSERLHTLFRDLEFRKLAEEYESQSTTALVNICPIKTVSDVKAVTSKILEHGKVAFLMDVNGESGLFDSVVIYLTLGDEKVYAVEGEARTSLNAIFDNQEILKVTYNLKAMLKMLSNDGFIIKGKVFDVMLAGYLLGPTQSFFDLDNLAWQYLKTTLPKENALGGQVEALMQLYPLLKRELEEKSLLSLFEDIEMPLASVLFKVEHNGVNLDLTLLQSLSNDSAKKINNLTHELFEMAGEEFNLNSPKQLGGILFEKLKLPVIKKTKTGFSTNESVLTILAENHRFPALILEYRKLSKLKSTYIDALPKLINPETGRLHAQFNQTGTETGRLSSSQPNLQNIPIRTELGRQIRKAIVPSNKDLIMIAADYSQIELRILAHLSGDQNLITAFQKDEDIHQFTASLIFDVEELDVTAQMRNYAKRVNFGLIYGMSAFGLAKDLKVSQSEAQLFIDRYFLRYPDVKKFMDREIRQCEELGYVLTILNRRRYIPEIKSTNISVRQFAQRQAINTPVQGSAADLMKLAMINIQRELERRDLQSRMISTVHDELVFESPEAERAEMISLIGDHMEHAITLNVPVKVSIKAGKNWLDMKEI